MDIMTACRTSRAFPGFREGMRQDTNHPYNMPGLLHMEDGDEPAFEQSVSSPSVFSMLAFLQLFAQSGIGVV
jgi:hypothetical protein